MDHFNVTNVKKRLYLLDSTRWTYGYYETLIGSRYRTFRIRKQIRPWFLDDLEGTFQGHDVKIVHNILTVVPGL